MNINKKSLAKALSVGAATVVLATGTALPAFATSASPVATSAIIYQDVYKTIQMFNKADLESLTGLTLTTSKASSMQSALTKASVWESAGFDSDYASYVASRFKTSKQQAQNILKDIAQNPELGLKVIVVDNGRIITVNIGSEYYGGTDMEEPGEEENNPGSESGSGSEITNPGSSVLSNIKEFEIEIEYAKQDVELSYNYEKADKCVFENEFTGEKLKGSSATELAAQVLDGVDLNSASQKDIASYVISKLGLSKNYKKFQIKIKYLDGTKVEFKLK